MTTELIRCQECKRLYQGDPNKTTEVFDIEATAIGDQAITMLPAGKFICARCQAQATERGYI